MSSEKIARRASLTSPALDGRVTPTYHRSPRRAPSPWLVSEHPRRDEATGATTDERASETDREREPHVAAGGLRVCVGCRSSAEPAGRGGVRRRAALGRRVRHLPEGAAAPGIRRAERGRQRARDAQPLQDPGLDVAPG